MAINIVNFTPYNLLLEYARVNGIEIYPYDSEADLRARIIKRQVNVKVERVKGEAEIKDVARSTIGRGGGRVQLKSADYVERYTIKEADEEIIFLYGNVTLELYNNIIFLLLYLVLYFLVLFHFLLHTHLSLEESWNNCLLILYIFFLSIFHFCYLRTEQLISFLL